MNGHPTDPQLTAYTAAALPPAELLVVDDHLGACAACRERALALSGGHGRVIDTVDMMRDELAADARQPVPASRPVLRWAAIGAVAASVAITLNVIWGTRTTSSGPVARPTPVVAQAPTHETLTADEQALVDRAEATGELPRATVLASLKPPSGVLMGTANPTAAFGPLSPLSVVDTERPTLSWTAAAESDALTEYRAEIFDERYEPVVRSAWQRATTWTPDRALSRGHRYVWQVTARTRDREITAPAPPQPEATFMVTTAEQSLELASLRRRAGDSHIALAVLLANAGVLDEAERELTLASQQNPQSSIVQRLQASLRKLR